MAAVRGRAVAARRHHSTGFVDIRNAISPTARRDRVGDVALAACPGPPRLAVGVGLDPVAPDEPPQRRAAGSRRR